METLAVTNRRKCATEDVSSPFHLNSGDNPSVILVNPQLNGGNFHSWSRSMRIALGAKNKLSLISKDAVVMDESNQDYMAWKRCDLMIQSWILNSCTKEIAQCILYADTAAEMWSILDERFAQGNYPRIFELQKEIYATVQGQSTVTEYYNKLDILWKELHQYHPTVPCTCGAIKNCTCNCLKAMTDREERNMSIKFLMSLNDTFAGIRGQILVMKPFPSLNQIYSFVIQDERQRNIGVNTTMQHESMAMIGQKANSDTTEGTRTAYYGAGNRFGRGNGFQNKRDRNGFMV